MTTEADMRAALDGHLYSIVYTKNGPKVVNRLAELPPAEQAKKEENRKKFAAPPIDWTAKDELLVFYRKEGLTYRQIATRMSISLKSIGNRFTYLVGAGVVDASLLERKFYNRYNIQLLRKVIELREESKLSFGQIALRMNMTKSAVTALYLRWKARQEKPSLLEAA